MQSRPTTAEPAEGVIKFRADHQSASLSFERFGALAARLSAWRAILFDLGILGQDPSRYDGAAFGNVSARVGPFPGARGARPFLITGTQTGGRRCVSLDDYCVVTAYDAAANRVESYGAILPSSESLTHGAVYDLSPAIRFVFHVHAPAIFERARRLNIPTTAPDVPYGTPEMAEEVKRLWREAPLAEVGLCAMGGHEDGILSFGRTAEEAGASLVHFLAQAFEDGWQGA